MHVPEISFVLSKESSIISISMFCSACGSQLEATNKFCPSCGHKAVGKSEAYSKKDDRKDIRCLSFEQFASKKKAGKVDTFQNLVQDQSQVERYRTFCFNKHWINEIRQR